MGLTLSGLVMIAGTVYPGLRSQGSRQPGLLHPGLSAPLNSGGLDTGMGDEIWVSPFQGSGDLWQRFSRACARKARASPGYYIRGFQPH
jgi:hypothetical protein